MTPFAGEIIWTFSVGAEALQARYAQLESEKQLLLTNAPQSYLEFRELLD